MNVNGNALRERLLAKRSEESVPGIRGICMINHGSCITISIKTPLGRLFQCETTFIGSNGTDYFILALPEVSPHDLDDYFCEGYWVSIKAISDRGEGAIVRFKTQMDNIIQKPERMITLRIPQIIGLTQLRSEARYEVKLQGHVSISNRLLLVEFKDLSPKGCCFVYGANGPSFDTDNKITIVVKHPVTGQNYRLTGVVRSAQKMSGLNNCGVLFDNDGQDITKQLLAQLIFDGSRLSFKA
ncbi:MAG: PilZ domain-containing protein [Photobacterium frigidiphilum]|uniref:PilZ domain-containing protein n=1 Tax=Photobacterium frigidiphilum TaxID=264736 RepID=UPI00300153A8